MSTFENSDRLPVTITNMTEKSKLIRINIEEATPDCLICNPSTGCTRPAFREVYRGRSAEWVLNEMTSGEILVKRVDAEAGMKIDDVVQLLLSRVCWD